MEYVKKTLALLMLLAMVVSLTAAFAAEATGDQSGSTGSTCP